MIFINATLNIHEMKTERKVCIGRIKTFPFHLQKSWIMQTADCKGMMMPSFATAACVSNSESRLGLTIVGDLWSIKTNSQEMVGREDTKCS